MDPVHTALLAMPGLGRVIDAGCGRGQVGVALLEAGHATAVVAIDKDANALAQLEHAAAGLAVRTRHADLASWGGEIADTVLLIDVLYQFATEQQLAVLRHAAGVAGQTVIIRASDPARGWRSMVSALLERLGRDWWPTFGARSNPLPIGRLTQTLAECGFQVSTRPCAEGTPLAGMLLVGTRIRAA